MLNAAESIVRFVDRKSFPEYERDALLKAAVERQIGTVGRYAERLSIGFRTGDPEIDWERLIAQKDELLHNYRHTDDSSIWRVATVDMPLLVERIKPHAKPDPPCVHVHKSRPRRRIAAIEPHETDLSRRIGVAPGICDGLAHICGTEVIVADVLHLLGKGMTEQQVAQRLELSGVDDVRACLLYASWGFAYPCRAVEATELQQERLTFEPGKLGGKACIRGIRMSAAQVIGMVAAGMSFEEIHDDFPFLEKEDITAALEYGASLAEHNVTPPRISHP